MAVIQRNRVLRSRVKSSLKRQSLEMNLMMQMKKCLPPLAPAKPSTTLMVFHV